eukprot:TRINITY_DN6287_c0_g1_i1.p1 TRINITY_DN6287_c0_g1~~TRINITY_DN6287_c0_g1_i1.p1  ORF type:complete len:185 (-),score=34.15 TRINITY_DN6287_c0_g1_i1:23-577(-)
MPKKIIGVNLASHVAISASQMKKINIPNDSFLRKVARPHLLESYKFTGSVQVHPPVGVSASYVYEFRIRSQDIDQNHHVSHSQFPAFACDALDMMMNEESNVTNILVVLLAREILSASNEGSFHSVHWRFCSTLYDGQLKLGDFARASIWPLDDKSGFICHITQGSFSVSHVVLMFETLKVSKL